MKGVLLLTEAVGGEHGAVSEGAEVIHSEAQLM